ncbi:MAG: DUF2807 domain-containing protein [Bacteroidetes bacterium]|nr:DUF2807 domain-containing protein [Bacteroidota bacterium]
MVKRRSNKTLRYWFIFILAALSGSISTVSCTKGGKCFSNSGTVIMQERPVSAFDSIDLGDNVNLILTQDSVDKITVEAGSNIISGITTEIHNKQLSIRNLNTCNWVRSYNKPLNVHVSVHRLWKIYYNAAGNVTSTNTLTGDSIKTEVWGGCGTIDLNLSYNKGWFIMNMGTADYNFHGRCDIADFYLNDMGLIQAKDLTTRYCSVTNRGTNNCYINVKVSLWAIISNIGSVYYTGDPTTVGGKITGSGVLEPFVP